MMTACFVAVYCKQQWEVQIEASAASFSVATDAWRLAVAKADQEDAEDAPLATASNAPSTRQSLASNEDTRPLAAHETVATSDLGDADK